MLSRWVVNVCSPKSGLRTEMTNGILYLSSCMKSQLFVAFMIKFRQDFTEYKSSEKPMNTLHFSPLVQPIAQVTDIGLRFPDDVKHLCKAQVTYRL